MGGRTVCEAKGAGGSAAGMEFCGRENTAVFCATTAAPTLWAEHLGRSEFNSRAAILASLQQLAHM